MLTEAQLAALDYVRGGNPGRTALIIDAPITINFHPDRSVGGGTVIEGLAADGRFRSQFETGISNGGLTAFPGGDRDRWEERMFGGVYQRPGVRARDRPKYGALNLLHHDDGGAPRFGSAHLRLRPHVLRWATFTFGDSARHPTEAGTADAFDAVLAALRAHHGPDAFGADAFRAGHGADVPHSRRGAAAPPAHHGPDALDARASHSGHGAGALPVTEGGAVAAPVARHGADAVRAIGHGAGALPVTEGGAVAAPVARHGADAARAIGHGADALRVTEGGAVALSVPRSSGGPGRALDDYVEAQIHGPVRLAEDVEALVLDSSFKRSTCGTAEAADLLAARYGLAVEWREGFRLAPADIPPEFRGPEVPVLAAELCVRFGVQAVDPALIGVAARDPASWAAWGSPAEVLQLLKYLWHCLVQFG